MPDAPLSTTSYDDFPYESRAAYHAHADRLCSVGKLFGMATPDITSCRVLELGCAEGGNLLPMAVNLPGSTFVGVDLSTRQVEAGREVVNELGLSRAARRVGGLQLRGVAWSAVHAAWREPGSRSGRISRDER